MAAVETRKIVKSVNGGSGHVTSIENETDSKTADTWVSNSLSLKFVYTEIE